MARNEKRAHDQMMSDGTDNPTTTGYPGDQPPPPVSPTGPPPQPPAPVEGPRRLVRDPTARLGGVAGGLSHYFGIDRSLLRVGFVVFTLFSGVGLVAYLLLWIVVPRSDYWPPLYSQRATLAPQRLTNRDVFLSFAILLALGALVVETGWGLSWLVGLLLVAGAVWLLNQEADPGPTVNDPASGEGQIADGVAPVRIEPRRRRLVLILLGVFAVPAALLIAVLTAGALLVGNGGFDFELGSLELNSELETGTNLEPATVREIPPLIDAEFGEVVLDLSQLEADDFDSATPIDVEVRLRAGEIVVLIPEGLAIDASAQARLGDVTIFEDSRDGLSSSVSLNSPDEVLDLDLNVGLGEIRVERS